ncbi:MAG: protein-tyrosine-phosphatase [Microscillaceae bacterium]|nr:protein-tyrosine-phosphatase [Microscillaceae bacterium]
MKKSVISLSLFIVLMSTSPLQEIKGQTSQVKNKNSDNSKLLDMYPTLKAYIASIQKDMEAIPEERKEALQKIALFVKNKKQSGEAANLIFICTHNSRRSHLSQIWAATAAHYYGMEEGIHTFSGGTEATAFNPRAVAAIERAGFKVENPGGKNPFYQVKFDDQGKTIKCFSKKYDDPTNPKESFAAVMTCSEADKNCPYIPGASLRVSVPYEDPKIADDTAQETSKYDERCRQIATEMFYLMKQVKN